MNLLFISVVSFDLLKLSLNYSVVLTTTYFSHQPLHPTKNPSTPAFTVIAVVIIRKRNSFGHGKLIRYDPKREQKDIKNALMTGQH